ncbi:MAG: hypothetical protein ACLRPW_05360 [Intestinibacter sp.]
MENEYEQKKNNKATLALVAMMTVTSVVGCSQSNNSNKNQQGSNQKTEQKQNKNRQKKIQTQVYHLAQYLKI